jgi:hypothetical protein
MPTPFVVPPFAGFSWATWAAFFLSLFALLLCVWLFLRLRRPPATPAPEAPSAVPDVLGAVLKRTEVPETDGVRWDVALYPDSLSVPGYVVLTAILQNFYDQPRTVTLEVAPDTLLPQGHAGVIALKPGEAGILRTPLFVSRTLPPGQYRLRATLSARAPQGEGTRLLNVPRHRERGPRTVSLRVISHHEHPPVNLFAYEWKGFTSLYSPPQAAPDLTELRILEELPSSPAES